MARGKFNSNPVELDKEFAAALRAARRQLGITQVTLGAQLGFPRNIIQEWENHVRRRNFEHYMPILIEFFPQLARYKNIPPSRMSEPEPEHEPEPELELHLPLPPTEVNGDAPAPSDLVSGLLVRVKSGGPSMTVERVEADYVLTVWFTPDGVLYRDKFLQNTLETLPHETA
jgi:uncharacterized protein YodC (DUF2158 family)